MRSSLEYYRQQLQDLKQQQQWRSFPEIQKDGLYVRIAEQRLLNLSSNDYLGLAANTALVQDFLAQSETTALSLGSTSSRLLTGNEGSAKTLEQYLSHAFGGRAVLLFNSGYHMNTGLIPALARYKTLILSDQYNHASMIDGIRLAKADCLRFAHNDMQALEALLVQYHDRPEYERLLIVTESIFSMDGDEADLPALVALKRRFPKVLLYVDEAHAFGVRGPKGLGCVEEQQLLPEIDFICGTFGKACASYGGYVVCESFMKDYFINTVRSLIFSTALPAMNWAWTLYICQQLPQLAAQRQHLSAISQRFRQLITQAGYACPSSSHIVPAIIGDNPRTIARAQALQAAGFYVLPIRVPTVPAGTARLRFSLHAGLDADCLSTIANYL